MPKRRPPFVVESRILFLRGQRVILDSDLAELYRVPARQLNQQVKRNPARFPPDFVFRISRKEQAILRSQIVISSVEWGGRRYLPYAFTEHGATMAATVLNSKQAIQMSLFVVRAFIRLREMLAINRQLTAKVDELERKLQTHDSAIGDLIQAIRDLSAPEPQVRKRIGFQIPSA